MTGERLVVERAHLVLARALRKRLESRHGLATARRPVIAIAGESGSGKSITATALAQVLGEGGRPTVVLYQDDYFVRPPKTNHAHRCRDLGSVGPQEVNLALLAEHVAAFRAGRAGIVGPRSDHATDSFLARRLDFTAVAVLIVEGTYVLGLADADMRVFLEATREETAERRRQRARDADEPIIDRILAIEHALIAPQAERADIVIDRGFAIRG